MISEMPSYLCITLVFLTAAISTPVLSSTCQLSVDTDHVENIVEEYFLSFCIDSFMFDPRVRWHNFNFSSPKLHTLMLSMSPSILRIGGGPADYLFFDVPHDALNSSGIKPDPIVMTKSDLLNLVKLTRETKSRLLFDFNARVRYGYSWDPSNAIAFLEFCEQNKLGENIDFELGNEPDYLMPDLITPALLGHDFQTLVKVVRHYHSFNRSIIVGPDIISATDLALQYLASVVNSAGESLRAATFHHYYFRGDVVDYKEYLKASFFGDLENNINAIKNTMFKTKYPSLDIWIGETSDSWHSGTANVSDRFVSGFLWLEKLGLSALMGVKVIMRQTLFGYDYALLDQSLNPNPDFWLLWLHKQFVGRRVFHVKSSCTGTVNETQTFRIYAHCTKPSLRYKAGSVTLFALNMNTESPMDLEFGGDLKKKPYHVYLVEPGQDNPIPVLSKFCKVNGKLLMMPSETAMPEVTPQSREPGQLMKLPPLTYAFIVFYEASAKTCLAEG